MRISASAWTSATMDRVGTGGVGAGVGRVDASISFRLDMHLRPGRATGVNATMPQKEGLKVLSRFPEPVVCDLSRSYQIANRLMRFIWHPDRGPLASPMESGSAYSATTVGLDPVARTLGNERWHHHLATVA